MSEQPRPDQNQGRDRADSPELGWERDLLTRLAFAALNEQRRARRWNLVFKFSLLAYLTVLLVLYLPVDWLGSARGGRHTALVNVSGVIRPQGDVNADRVVTGLRAAFEDEDTAGVIVRINSPGGSPVQAGYINDEVRRLRKKYPDIPVYAVISDICASGGYYVAVAADKIYADKASLVGSIGVLLNGFGFVDAMDKVGVERRLLTAGSRKALFDPFSPLREEDLQHMRTMIDTVHQQFIEVVKSGRGERLSDHPDLFSGLVWTGKESLELGLVDALGNASFVAREVIGEERIVDFTVSAGLLNRLSRRLGAAIGEGLATHLSIQGLRLE